MTVSELIEKLSVMPPTLIVMADDYEDGAYEIADVTIRDFPSPAHVALV